MPSVKISPAPAQILAVGDSQTRAYDKAVKAKEFWTSRLQIDLRAAGYAADTINLGNSGWTSTQTLAIMQGRIARFNPDILLIYIGVNDPGAAIAGATTQANIQAMIDFALSTANATTVKGVGIIDTNYLNYSTGEGGGATYATLRTYQLAAANYGIATYPGKVFYVPLFSWQSNLIATAVWTALHWQDSQIADLDQHMNANAHAQTSLCVKNYLTASNLMTSFLNT